MTAVNLEPNRRVVTTSEAIEELAEGSREQPVGSRAARRLREEVVVWMTTVTPAGTLVRDRSWFLWDGEESVFVYSGRAASDNIEGEPARDAELRR